MTGGAVRKRERVEHGEAIYSSKNFTARDLEVF